MPIPQCLQNLKVGLFSSLHNWKYRNKCAAFQALVEFHRTFDGRKDGVILALPDALARPKLVAALTHDDIAGDDRLATIKFHAKAATS